MAKFQKRQIDNCIGYAEILYGLALIEYHNKNYLREKYVESPKAYNEDRQLLLKYLIDTLKNIEIIEKPITEHPDVQRLIIQTTKLTKALNYAKHFIDGYGEARVKENLGRDGMDAVLKEIDKIAEKTDICPICRDEKPINDLHRNCGA